jgi:hypothetical protein
MRFKLSREFYIPKGAVKVSDKRSDAVAYLTSNHAGKPCAMVFYGKQSKPVANYRFRDDAERAQSIERLFTARQAHDKRQADRRAEDKAFVHDAQVGDIYRTCWGYDQTNVEFFQIVEIKGKWAILREIAAAVDERTAGGPSERIGPQTGAFLEPRPNQSESSDYGKPIRRLIQKHGIKICDVRTAWKWGAREPITGTIIGDAVSRTGSGWGH